MEWDTYLEGNNRADQQMTPSFKASYFGQTIQYVAWYQRACLPLWVYNENIDLTKNRKSPETQKNRNVEVFGS